MTDVKEVETGLQEPYDGVRDVRPVELHGEIDAGTDLSGVVVVGDFLVMGADEGHRLQVLAREPSGRAWRLQHQVALAKQDQETDIEAIAFDDGFLYVVGSHSFRRRRLKPDLPVRKNRERLLQVNQDVSRNRLYRLPFDAVSGAVDKAECIDLSKRLRKDPLLKRFFGLPSKENGIDIEGMTCRDGVLYLGFRGPVLRDNYVPVMALRFAEPKRYELSFVRLGGQGIRDMTVLDDGFLILSGPVNDAPGPFCLWWWDGEDQVPGKGRSIAPARMLGAISTAGGAKAEGLALIAEHEGLAEILVVYDTDTTAQAVTMQVALTSG